MNKYSALLILCFISLKLFAQNEWQWEELNPMPMAISNNAVVSANAFGTTFIYSFGGIDSTKIFSGISNSSYRYDTQSGTWEAIEDIPNPIPVIAAGASTVNGLIYIIGGYTVSQNDSETSVNDVHIFDPQLNGFISAGAPTPVAIDDHVQCVYRDSLIYVVTGWSNNTNVNNVQIYDTYNDVWLEGTSLLNNNDYRVFGGSGEIIGDTLYYIGGARLGTNFPLGSVLRKGFINPLDPTEITWTAETMISEALGYRMAVAKWQDRIFWFGGSSVSYNYNGIAYNGSGGVPPENRIIQYTSEGGLEIIPNAMPENDNEFYLCGGMIENQVISDKLFKVSYINTTTSSIYSEGDTHSKLVYPNPTDSQFYIEGENSPLTIKLISIKGQSFSIDRSGKSYTLSSEITDGLYFIPIDDSHLKVNVIR